MKFIYVFSLADKEQLESLGYTLLKEDTANSIYVFDSSNVLTFNFNDMKYVLSNTLTF